MDWWIATVQGILCVGHLTPSLSIADDTQTDRRRSDGIRYPRLCLYGDIGTLSSEPTLWNKIMVARLIVQVLHQFAADTPYVVYMSDANGDGTGESPIDSPSFGNLLTL